MMRATSCHAVYFTPDGEVKSSVNLLGPLVRLDLLFSHCFYWNLLHHFVCSYLAIVAVAEVSDPASGSDAAVVGFAAFSDSPVGTELGDKIDADAWITWLKGAFGTVDIEVCVVVHLLHAKQ